MARIVVSLACATGTVAAHAAELPASPETAPAQPVSAPAPAPYIAEYEVLRNGKPLGRGTVTLRRSGGGTWELLSVTRGTKGLANLANVEIVEKSILHWRDGRPESRNYDYRQQAAWKTRDRSVVVDADRGTIASRDRDKHYEFKFADHVLDRQAITLAMSQDLAAGRRDDLVYTVVDRDEFGPQRYRVKGEESVQIASGSVRALRVDRLRTDRGGRETSSWFGLDNGFVPVRVLQHEPDGDSYEMRLVSLKR